MSVTDLEIIGIPAEGNVSAWFVPEEGIQDPATGPTAGEMTAPGVVNLTALVSPTAPTATVGRTTKRRLGSKRPFELFGSETYTIDALEYPFDPQPAGEGEDMNAAYEGLTPGAGGFIVMRWGVDSATAPTAGQVVDVFQVLRLGPQVKQPPAENDEMLVQQEVALGPVWTDVVIQAGGGES